MVTEQTKTAIAHGAGILFLVVIIVFIVHNNQPKQLSTVKESTQLVDTININQKNYPTEVGSSEK